MYQNLYIYFWDESKHLKKFEFSETESKTCLKQNNDYYVHDDFDGLSTDYAISKKMLYIGIDGYLLQEKENATKEKAIKCMPDGIGIDNQKIDYGFPIWSSSILLFMGKNQSHQRKIIILPEYHSPKSRYMGDTELRSGEFKGSHFFAHDENYIVCYHFPASKAHIEVIIKKKNGEIYQKLEINLKWVDSNNYIRFSLSPNGRYMFYFEHETNETVEVEQEGEDNDDGHHDYYNSYKQIKPVSPSIGKIVELMVDCVSKQFKHVLRREILDFEERYKFTAYDFNKYFYSYGYHNSNNQNNINANNFEFFITDKMEIICINKTDKILMYEEIHFEQNMKEKLRLSIDSEEENTFSDLSWLVTNGAVIAHSQSFVYYCLFDKNNNEVKPLMQVDFKINSEQLRVYCIHKCVGCELLVIILSNDDNKYLTLVWNLETNTEVYNFSSDTYFKHINGAGSKSGYLLMNDFYANLDKGLANYFYEWVFFEFGTYNVADNGYLMNRNEDCMILSNMILQKETLLELDTIDDFISGNFVLSKNNICLDRIRFNLDGNSTLHYFALNSETLSLVLDYMEEYKIGYLNAILMKNQDGKSPIDITIINESPKCTELLFRKLPLFKDSTLSSLFSDRFADLFKMNLQSFHKYLDSCFFQTMQMKKTKNLKLKSDADPLLITHSNCLIDENFIEKYCISDKQKEDSKQSNNSERYESAQEVKEN